jgi:acetyl-CoA carboxylase biotin carboxyl carrier protein
VNARPETGSCTDVALLAEATASVEGSPEDPEVPAQHPLDAVSRTAALLLHVTGGGVSRLRVSFGTAAVELAWPDCPTAAADTAAAVGRPTGTAPDGGADPAAPEGRHQVLSPLVGTFYRAPEPSAPPHVQVGDVVGPGQTIGIVEAMKLMNPVEADVAGRVMEILVGDGEPVEFAQALVSIAPFDG